MADLEEVGGGGRGQGAAGPPLFNQTPHFSNSKSAMLDVAHNISLHRWIKKIGHRFDSPVAC